MYKSTKKSVNWLNIKLSTQRRNVKRGRKGNETVHIGKYFTETPTVKNSPAAVFTLRNSLAIQLY